MCAEIVGGVVGGADDFDVHFLQNALRGQVWRGERGICFSKNVFCCARVQQVIYAKIPTQFEVCPVKKRVANGVRNRLGPFFKLLPIRGIARDESFSHALCPHRPPFVVVAFEPDFGDAAKLPVRGDIVRREMIVVVNNRLPRRVFVEEFGSEIIVQQEVIAEERTRFGHRERTVWLRHGFVVFCERT